MLTASAAAPGALGLATLLLVVNGAQSVRITSMRVPPAVRNGSSHTVLDCEYVLKPEEADLDRGLVVKWYFNNGPTPVYQWIPGGRPQDLGVLKGKLNLNHRVSDHRATKHRALYIVNPTTELSGEYKCHVSTFEEEDFMTKRMVVYAPGRKFDLVTTKPDPDTVRVTCSAKDLYPEPKLALYKTPDGSKLNAPEVLVETTAKKGAYDIRASATLLDSELESPTFFDCELRIPEVGNGLRKTLVYYPGTYDYSSAPASPRPSWAAPLSAMLAPLLLARLLRPAPCDC